MEAVDPGSDVLRMLIGSLEPGVFTTLYGPPGAGKTTFVLQAALAEVRGGRRVVLIDTEQSLSLERFFQLGGTEDMLARLILFKPVRFAEQRKAFERAADLAERGEARLIIVDSVSMLYRLILPDVKEIPEASRLLSQQLRILHEAAVSHNAAILLTSHAYAREDDFGVYGGEFIRYVTKTLIEVAYEMSTGQRELILRKHRSRREGIRIPFIIQDTGCLPQQREA